MQRGFIRPEREQRLPVEFNSQGELVPESEFDSIEFINEALNSMTSAMSSLFVQAQIETVRLKKTNQAIDQLEKIILDSEIMDRLSYASKIELHEILCGNVRRSTNILMDVIKYLPTTRTSAAVLENMRDTVLSNQKQIVNETV